MKKVLIPTKLDTVAADMLKEKGYEVTQEPGKKLDELANEFPDTEVLIVRSDKVTPEIIDKLKNLKLIVRAGAGYNTIDTKYARRNQIDVMNTPGANSNAVAEEVIALILAACRHIVVGDNTTRAGQWEKKKLMGRELANKTIGIIGLGNIGQLLVKRLQGFNMEILAFDPFVSADLAEKLGVRLCSVKDIFSKADIISLHIPETDETKGMVNSELLSLVKPGVVLVNCARAGVINENDLRALKAEKNITFCNDVYPKDEAGEKTITDVADVMLPHLGASTFEANHTAAKRSAEQIIAYFEKGVTNYVVNKGVPDGLDEKFQTLAYVITRLARNYLGKSRALHQIEMSLYGDLNQYGKWLLAPIVAGISSDFDPYLDASDAEEFLKSRGISVSERDIDDSKNYGESMTIDLFEGEDTINKVSVRGTITENNLMIARINDFEKLYLEPTGHNLFAEYSDKPGVLGKITSMLGESDINIIDIRAPQDISVNNALAIIKTNVPVPENLQDKIKDLIDAKTVFGFSY